MGYREQERALNVHLYGDGEGNDIILPLFPVHTQEAAATFVYLWSCYFHRINFRANGTIIKQLRN
jgi:hypothetical protein